MKNRILGYFITLAVVICSCSNSHKQKTYPFPRNVEDIQTRIYEYVGDSTRMPNVEVIYNIEDSIIWRLVAKNDNIYYIREIPSISAKDTVSSIDMYENDFQRMRQLISALNPHTLPYYYGDRVEDDPTLILMIEGDTILFDKDFSTSIVPSEIVQIYKELFRDDYIPDANYSDFPPYNYNSFRR